MSIEIDSPEFTDDFVKRYIQLNRPGQVEEIASISLFLSGDERSFNTGQTIVAEGATGRSKTFSCILEKTILPGQ